MLTTTTLKLNRQWNRGFLIGAAFLAPILGYLFLPLLGVGFFKQLFELKRLLLMLMALIGGSFYLYYFRYLVVRPQLLVVFMTVLLPIVTYLNGYLLAMGINIHFRPLLILAIAMPSVWISFQYRQLLWQQLPWLKYYLFFVGWLILYAVFYNAHATDPSFSGGEAASGEGSVSLVQSTQYIYCLLSITVSAVTMLRARQPHRLFDNFNKLLILVSTLESIMTILGFPFGVFSLLLDGFTRATGLLSHPNPFAHHMGVLMVYFTGLFCYYQGERKERFPGWFLWIGLGVNGLAFLLGLSKTALGVFSVCTLLIFLLNLRVPAVRQGFSKIIMISLCLIPIGLAGFQLLSGENFFALLESRIAQTQSLSWRTLVWQELISDINLGSVWLGHGLTAANEVVFRATFSNANAKPLMMVHNAYIALVYDLGILGYLMFLTAIRLCWESLQGCLSAVRSTMRTEYSMIFALGLYFLIVCGFDEMSYMFDAPLQYWILSTLLYCLCTREKQLLQPARLSR